MNPDPLATSQHDPLRVLVFSQHYWPESFRINDVTESLIAAGCEVLVLTGQPNYPEGRIFPGYRALACGRERHPAGYSIHRVPLMPRGKGGAARLVANYLSFICSAALLGPWVIGRRRIDVILVYGTSPILQAIGAIVLRALYGARLVTWVQDLWPESLEVTGYVRHPRVLAAVATVVRWIYRRTDLLLVQGPAFVPAVRAMAGGTPVEVHPNPGERAFEKPPAEQQSDEPAYVLPPGFNVVFAGNLGTAQALDTVVEAARLLRDSPGIRIVLIGSGARSAWLQQTVFESGLDNLLLPGRFAPEHLPPILAQASALLVSLARSDIMALTIPSKMQAYLAAGRPIIASLDGEGARVVTEAGAGVAAPAEDAPALAAAILHLSRVGDAALSAMGEAGRRYYMSHYQSAALAGKLRDRLLALRASSA